MEEARPKLVFHLGAYTHVGKSWERVDECIQTNMQGTVNLLQALARSDYQRFVYTSTSEVYGDIEVPFREDAAVESGLALRGEQVRRRALLPDAPTRAGAGRSWWCAPSTPTDRPRGPTGSSPRSSSRGPARERLAHDPGPPDPGVQLRRGPGRRLRAGGHRSRGSKARCSTSGAGRRCRSATWPKPSSTSMGNPIDGRIRGPPRPAHRDLVDAQRRDQGPRAAGPAGRSGRWPTDWRRRSPGTAPSWR